jgi:hypothetical protein
MPRTAPPMRTAPPDAYTFDTGRRRYVNARGRVIPWKAVRGAFDSVLEAHKSQVERLTERLVAGQVSVPTWRAQMAKLVKRGHTLSYEVAKGGRGQMTKADRATLKTRVAKELEYLNGFASDLARGVIDADGRAVSRATMYANAAAHTFEAVRAEQDAAEGFNEERRILGATDAHCEQCVSYAGRGWRPIGTLPLPGQQCACISNCRCSMERRRAVVDAPSREKPRSPTSKPARPARAVPAAKPPRPSRPVPQPKAPRPARLTPAQQRASDLGRNED